MFRELINNPIDPIPVEYTNTICRLENEPDYSLTSLGIAVLKPRVETYQGIYGKYALITDEEVAVDNFVGDNTTNQFTFSYYVYSNKMDDAKLKATIEEHGFEIKENIGTFLKEKANVDCCAVYHKEKNCTAIFINTRDMKYYHISISFLSLLYPQLFKEHPMTEQDYNVVKACSKTDKDAFIQRIQECLQPYAMEFRRMMLNTLLKTMHEGKINYARRELDNQRSYVDSVQVTLSDALKHLKELTVTFEGLVATEKFDEAEEDLVEYLSTTKEIRAMKMEGSVLNFSVATLLNNYNPDAWRTFAQRGYIYDGKYGRNGDTCTLLDVFNDKNNRKILLDNIFSETPEFAVKIAGNYRIDLDNYRVTARSDYDYNAADPIFKSYMPNPHIKLFRCLGGYEGRIPDQLRKRNYIGAIQLCIASAGSVDLDETQQTFRPFLGWLLNCREKILHRKDGVDMTPEEALIYLIDKEKENETHKDD